MIDQLHFEMNKDHLKAKGIDARLYTVDSTAEKGMSKKYFPGTGIEKLKKWKELASTNTKWDLAI